MNILVTGGAGYIGSHTVVELGQTQRRRRRFLAGKPGTPWKICAEAAGILQKVVYNRI